MTTLGLNLGTLGTNSARAVVAVVRVATLAALLAVGHSMGGPGSLGTNMCAVAAVIPPRNRGISTIGLIGN